MSEELDRLKSIGAQKIYEDTHIPVNQVQAILYENYDGLSKVQFVGFISILEREYGADLNVVKAKGIAYFDEQKTKDEAEYTERIYIEPEVNKRRKMIILLVIAIFALLFALYFTLSSAKESMKEQQESSLSSKIENHPNEDKTPKEETVLKVQNLTEENTSLPETNVTKEVPANEKELDANTTNVEQTTISKKEVQQEEVEQKEEPKTVPTSLKILPKTKVWVGYIDVKTNKKYQKTIRYYLHLDPKKEWILLFGHGYVTIEIDGVKHTFSQKDTLRLHYKDGEVEKISEREFKRLNRGRKW